MFADQSRRAAHAQLPSRLQTGEGLKASNKVSLFDVAKQKSAANAFANPEHVSAYPGDDFW